MEFALKEFPKLSSREIAKVCAVSHVFVEKARPAELETVTSPTRVGADGKERKMPAPDVRSTPSPVAAPTS